MGQPLSVYYCNVLRAYYTFLEKMMPITFKDLEGHNKQTQNDGAACAGDMANNQ
jgi:hypothetical protein